MEDFKGEIISGGGVFVASGLAYLLRNVFRKEKPPTIDENKHDGSNEWAVQEAYNSIYPNIIDASCDLVAELHGKLRGYYIAYLKKNNTPAENIQNNRRVLVFEELLSVVLRKEIQASIMEYAFSDRFCMENSSNIEAKEWILGKYDHIQESIFNGIDMRWKDDFLTSKGYRDFCQGWIKEDFTKYISLFHGRVLREKSESLKMLKGRGKKFKPYRVLRRWCELYRMSGNSRYLRG